MLAYVCRVCCVCRVCRVSCVSRVSRVSCVSRVKLLMSSFTSFRRALWGEFEFFRISANAHALAGTSSALCWDVIHVT